MPTFLRLVRCDNEVPLLLTLCDEHGNEIDRDTTPSDEAIRCAIMLLARSKALRPGYRLTVSMESYRSQQRGSTSMHPAIQSASASLTAAHLSHASVGATER